jgi:hypothetical protein
MEMTMLDAEHGRLRRNDYAISSRRNVRDGFALPSSLSRLSDVRRIYD